MKSESLDRAVKSALWYEDIKKTSNPKFVPLFAVESRYLALMGGAGSGKSIFAGRKIVERAASEKGHRFLVLRKVARTLRESCFRQLCAQIAAYRRLAQWKVNVTEMSITAPNGSQIIFAGLDDAEKLKSIFAITGIWIEEASEITQSDFNQIDIRLRGETQHYKQIILSFNPVSVTHWLKERFFDAPGPEVTLHHSTYKDNVFLDEAAKRVLEAYKDTDEYYYNVYCLGQWGVTGESVFDSKAVGARIQRLFPPIRRGLFEPKIVGGTIESWAFDCGEGGYVSIYEEPKANRKYVIGADTAGEGSDFFAAHVLEAESGIQAAVLHHKFDEDLFARQVVCLAKYYNDALVGIESNYSSYPIKEVERLGYENQYVRQIEDTFTSRIIKAYGFKTTAITRPVIIGELIKIVRESVCLINDRSTLEQMLSFVRNERGRAQAAYGAHDDLVMSLAIAHYIRSQAALERQESNEAPAYHFKVLMPRQNSERINPI